jgi:hypothetical protein
MELLHIETSGNQRFIFATNKLRENVGASQLIWMIGETARNAAAVRPGCRVIMATSGKATIVAPDRATAEVIVAEVTRKAVTESPGIDVHGAITSFEPARERLRDALERIRRDHESLRCDVPSPATRFLRLPCVADCSTSGLPAAAPDRRFHGIPGRPGHDLRSAVSQAKWIAADEGIERLAKAAGDVPVMRSVSELDDLQNQGLDWLAVIHADGNGLGQLLVDFDRIVERYSPGSSWDIHADLRDRFSQALDTCATNAFAAAVRAAWGRWQARAKRGGGLGKLPLVPLVLGGDDLTVICGGEFAVQFAADFLVEFERETRGGVVGELSALRPGATAPGLTACAGVAVIKPHFPFHAAYELAEELIASAKRVKRLVADRPCSAIDYHVLYDSSDASLERIRAALTVDEGRTFLTARPYVVSEGFENHPWAATRVASRLADRITAVTSREDNGRRRLANGMLHELREALFHGREAADARLRLILGRHEGQHFGDLLAADSLFHHDAATNTHHAFLLDALELDGFWSASGGEVLE